MRPARPITGYIREIQLKPLERIDLRTNDTVKNEVFGSLAFISEVEEVGAQFLRDRGHTGNIKKRYLQLQAFLRQAKTFYDAADALHYRASSLNYYYSFLNLVKAYITITDPAYVDRRTGHGLTHEGKEFPLSHQYVRSQRSGVFPKFYQLVTERSLKPRTRLKIADLLGYCSDVALEYEQAAFGFHRNIRCKYAIVLNTPEGKACPLVAIQLFDRLEKFRSSLGPFNRYFEEVDVSKRDAREIFDVMAEQRKGFRFFESRRDYTCEQDGSLRANVMNAIVGDSHQALKNCFSTNPYADGFDFLLALPLRLNLQIPMNEVLAIYVSMFFLGSLVRYNPRYLERILASRDAWIIERFAKTAPITFLRYMRNMIDGRNFVYVSR